MAVNLDPNNAQDKMVIDILVNNGKLKEGLAEADAAMASTAGKIEKSASNIEKLMAFQGVVSGVQGVTSGLANMGRELKAVADDYGRSVAMTNEFNAAMQRLGVDGEAAMNKIRVATRGSLSDDQIRKVVLLGDAYNIPMGKMQDFMTLSNSLARRFGEDADTMSEKIMTALGVGSERALKRLGLNITGLDQALKDYVVARGMASAADDEAVKKAIAGLDEQTKRQIGFNQMLKEQGDIIEAEKTRVTDFSDVIKKLGATLANLADTDLYRAGKMFGIFGDGVLTSAASVGQLYVAVKILKATMASTTAEVGVATASGGTGLSGALASMGITATAAGAATVAAFVAIAAEAVALIAIFAGIVKGLEDIQSRAEATKQIAAETRSVQQQRANRTGETYYNRTGEEKFNWWTGKTIWVETEDTVAPTGPATGQPVSGTTPSGFRNRAAAVQVNVNQMGGATVKNQQKRSMR